LPTDTGTNHVTPDLCIAALQGEVETLRRAIAMLTLGESNSETKKDSAPSRSPQKRTTK